MTKKKQKKKQTTPVHVSLVSSEPINLPPIVVSDSVDDPRTPELKATKKDSFGDKHHQKIYHSSVMGNMNQAYSLVGSSNTSSGAGSHFVSNKRSDSNGIETKGEMDEIFGFSMSEHTKIPTANQIQRLNGSDMVKLNVGGTVFCTSLLTLCSRGGMLAAMFSGRYSPYKDQSDCYFIDRLKPTTSLEMISRIIAK